MGEKRLKRGISKGIQLGMSRLSYMRRVMLQVKEEGHMSRKGFIAMSVGAIIGL
jgi:hypothetical protein